MATQADVILENTSICACQSLSDEIHNLKMLMLTMSDKLSWFIRQNTPNNTSTGSGEVTIREENATREQNEQCETSTLDNTSVDTLNETDTGTEPSLFDIQDSKSDDDSFISVA